VPCHRVIRADGSSHNYLYGLECKATLLAHELRNSADQSSADQSSPSQNKTDAKAPTSSNPTRR
jgi:hypothetical protein